MKRRNFLKGVALAALSPLAAMQPKKVAVAEATTEGCAAADQAIKVYESDPQKVGEYTKRLTSLVKAAMRNMGEQSEEARREIMMNGHRGLAGSIVEEPEYVAYTIPGVTELPKKNIIGYPIHVGYGCAILDDRRIVRLRF
jgi:hypothetical protein